MAAGMVADRYVLSRQLLRCADRRVRRHHDAARRDHVRFAPHPSDLLGGGLIDRPVARAGNVRFDTLVALRRQAAAKFIIEAGIAEIALLVSYPFLQTAVGLDREFGHDASPTSA